MSHLTKIYLDPFGYKYDKLDDVYGVSPFFSTKNATIATRATHVQRLLADWTDPTTPPQSKTECVKECSLTPWDTFCCGWATRWRYMRCKLYLDVRVGTEQDVIKAIEECLKEASIAAALAALVAAVVTGGAAIPAAKAAFIAELMNCLPKKLQNIISVDTWQTCGWSDWE